MPEARCHLVRLVGMVVACGIVLSTAACSDSEAGTPVPGGSSPAGKGSETEAPSTGDVPRSLADVDPCELLSSSDRAQLELGEGDSDDVAGARVCDWEADEFGITVGLHDDIGFKDANMKGATPVPVDVGRHEAYKVEILSGGDRRCGIFIVVTESSMAQLEGGALAVRDTPKVCNVISQVAQIIDPKLP